MRGSQEPTMRWAHSCPADRSATAPTQPQAGSFGCNGSAYNAAHNVHLVSTPDGIFSIEAPVSVAGTILLGMVSNGNSPTLQGDNWEFSRIYGMDTDFTRQNARGSRLDAQAEITPDQICGVLPKGFDSKAYATRPWKITAYAHDGDRFNLGGRTLEVIATPGHTPDSISLLDRANGLLFLPVTPTTPRPSGSSGQKPISMSTPLRFESTRTSGPNLNIPQGHSFFEDPSRYSNTMSLESRTFSSMSCIS
jgi:hypothetical protein